MLVALAAAIGVAAGGVAWLLLRAIGFLTNLALFHRIGWQVPSTADLDPSPWLIPVALAGALVVIAITRWAPAIRGHGIPEAQEAVLTRQSRVDPKTAVAKPTSIAVAIGTGAPFGAEGPIIVSGGAIGSLLGQVIPVTPSERKIMLGCGAAAGTAAVFGAPIAAVILAIELLMFEFSTRAIVPIVVAASVAGGVHVALFGSEPLFHVPEHDFSGLSQLWLFALLGIASGLLAVLTCRGLSAVERLYRRLPFHERWHPLVGALIFASVGLFVPRVLGTGYATIQDVLSDRLALDVLLVIVFAKLIVWWGALGSGTSGSVLAPVILIGAAFGAAFGHVAHEIAPGLTISVGAMAVVAMAATFGASIGASLTAIVFAFELTRDYDSILPLMLATVLANIVAAALLEHNLMTEKLARQGVAIPSGYEPDVLRTTRVRDAMTTPVESLSVDATVGDALSRLSSGSHSAYPLVDDVGSCVGIVTRNDVLADGSDPRRPVGDIASLDVVTVAPTDTMLDVLDQMVEEQVDHIPVVDADRLVGICTRSDLIGARARAQELERRQRGWRPPWHRTGSSS
jgi:H+/Cl- antiporter ClcA